MKKEIIVLVGLCGVVSLKSMQQLAVVGADGVRVLLDEAVWNQFEQTKSDGIKLPVSSTMIQRIDRWLVNQAGGTEIDAALAEAICLLRPVQSGSVFHCLAQQVARMHEQLYQAVAFCGDFGMSSDTLQKFLLQWPPVLRHYINLYVYLLLSSGPDRLAPRFTQLVHQDNGWAAIVQDLPHTADRALNMAVRRNQEAYSVYLLLLGAGCDQPVMVKKQCFCAECYEDIVDTNCYSAVPLPKYCAVLMPRVYVIMQQLSTAKK